MFYLPSKEEIDNLSKHMEPFSVTIYSPLIQETGGLNPNKLQLKNLLRSAEKSLQNKGLGPRHIRKTTRGARELLKDDSFWHLRDAGLVLFMHSNFFRYYQLPDNNLRAQVSVAQSFDLRPLKRVLADDEAYYLVAVSHKNVRFYQGGHYSIREIQVKDMPRSLKDDLRLDEYERWSETHTVAPASRQRTSEAFHSQANAKQTDKEELFRFFRHIDSRLRKYLRGKKVPLIFAGVGYLAPIYRKANTYPYLVSRAIKGSPDRKNADLLKRQAWQLISA